jgi:hypothetical protein
VKYSIVDLSNCFATPLSQKLGWTVNGPKIPMLPQLAAKLEPTSSPLDSAARAADGLALRRVRMLSASPENCNGSLMPRKVPKASLKIRSAAGTSFSVRGRIITAVSVFLFATNYLFILYT